MISGGLTIRPTELSELDRFFVYLNDHLSDNGAGDTALFMPIPRAESFFSIEKEASFRNGMVTPVGSPGWRRGWLALSADGRIAGHIDLRARPERACAHRALLGMGVHRDFRRQGVGVAMLEAAMAWAEAQGFAWVDLDVLSVNTGAIALYRQAGFTLVGEMQDMFRIDGQQVGHTFMTRRVGPL